MPALQNLKNHARLQPAFHFFILPLLLLNIIFAIYLTIHNWPAYKHTHIWWIVLSIIFFVMAGIGRGSALKVQDRVIRLEERLRLVALVSEPDRAHIHELTTPQLIALRFASDDEIPALVHKTLTQRLEPKAIKASINNWRPDYERV
jgi:Family of unknown function (DUF6526)